MLSVGGNFLRVFGHSSSEPRVPKMLRKITRKLCDATEYFFEDTNKQENNKEGSIPGIPRDMLSVSLFVIHAGFCSVGEKRDGERVNSTTFQPILSPHKKTH